MDVRQEETAGRSEYAPVLSLFEIEGVSGGIRRDTLYKWIGETGTNKAFNLEVTSRIEITAQLSSLSKTKQNKKVEKRKSMANKKHHSQKFFL